MSVESPLQGRYYKTAGVWSHGLDESSSVCIQKIVLLKTLVETVLMSMATF